MPLAYLLPDEAQSVPYAAASAATAAIATARRLSVLRQDAAARFSTLQAAAPAPATFSLRGEVSRVVDAILHAQSEAGWLGGPENDDPSNGDQYWVAWEVLWSLLQLAEAEPARRAGVRSALLAHVAEAHRRMEAAPLDGWSAVRWPEYGAILQAVGDAFGDEVGEAGAALLAEAYDRVAAQGFDWLAYFSGGGPAPSFNASLPFAPAWTLTEHGVNHAMALKEGAVAWRAGGGGAALDLTALKLRLLDRFHGQPTGVFSADECLGGLQPNRGVELCVTVELLFSLALLARTHGSVEHLDRMERIAFNALPGAVSEDFWAHNYLSQPNEARAIRGGGLA